MKMEIMNSGDKLTFRIEYSPREWRVLENYYETYKKEYRRGESVNIFGSGQSANVYFCRYDTSRLCEDIYHMVKEMLPPSERVKISIIDNINEPPLSVRNGELILNIAVFRAIPTFDQTSNRYVFEITLPEEFIYLPGIKYFRYIIKALVKRLELIEKGSKAKVKYVVEVVKE